jgi:hypothetical protein
MEEKPKRRHWLFGGQELDSQSGKPVPPPSTATADGGAKQAGQPQGSDPNKRPEQRPEPGSEPRSEPRSWQPPPPEPDRPLNPHSFSPRMQMLSNMRPPRVFIAPEAYKRMQLYIELARKEVGWLGTVNRLENGDFFVDQVFLLEQEVTPTETELSVEGQNRLVNQLLERGDEGLELVNTMRFWGHSHVRMGTSPSGTDERTMERWQSEGLPWAVRGIFNKLGRAEFTVYLYEQGYRFCDAPWAVMDPVTKRVILQQRYGYQGGGGYYGSRPAYEEGGRGWFGGGNAHSSIFGGGGYRGYGNGFQHGRPEFKVPSELEADEALRNEVTAEFAERVSERLLNLGWFRSERNEGGMQPVDNGDGAPPNVMIDDRSPMQHTGGGPVYRPGDRIYKQQPAQPGDKKPWSFWSWLFGSNDDNNNTPGNTGGDASNTGAPHGNDKRTTDGASGSDRSNKP